MNSESTLLRSLDPRIFDDHGAAVSFGEGATLSRAGLVCRRHRGRRSNPWCTASGSTSRRRPRDSGRRRRRTDRRCCRGPDPAGLRPARTSAHHRRFPGRTDTRRRTVGFEYPVDSHRYSRAICDVLSRTKRGSYRTDHVHLRNHRSSERRCPLASIDRCGSRRARSCVELDARGHTRPRTAPLPRPRVDSRRVGRLARGFAADSYRQTNSGFVCRSGWLVVLRCSDRLVTRVR